MSKLAKFSKRKRSSSLRANPPMGVDLVEYIGPGFGAFAATRILSRIVTSYLTKRFPSKARHAGAVAGVSAFLAAWFGAHRVKQLARYHHPIVVGSGLAALQTLVQTYVPGIGQLLADPAIQAAPAAPAAPKNSRVARMVQGPSASAPAPSSQDLPPGWSDVTPSQRSASGWSAYNDAYDAGLYEDSNDSDDAPMKGAMTDDQDDIDSLLSDDDSDDDSDEAYS